MFFLFIGYMSYYILFLQVAVPWIKPLVFAAMGYSCFQYV